MKFRYLLFLLSLSLFLNVAKAELVFDHEDQVGDITVNDTQYVAHYTFKNIGKSKVTVKDVKTSCGCTTARMEKHTYEPGEEGNIEVAFVFGYRRGVQHKDITVITDEGPHGDEKVYALSLSVLIPTKYTVTKRSHHWNVGGVATPWSFTVEMHPEWKAHLDSITCSKDAFAYTYKENAEEHTVTVAVTPKDTSQKIRDILNVYIDDGSGELKNISIFLSLREE